MLLCTTLTLLYLIYICIYYIYTSATHTVSHLRAYEYRVRVRVQLTIHNKNSIHSIYNSECAPSHPRTTYYLLPATCYPYLLILMLRHLSTTPRRLRAHGPPAPCSPRSACRAPSRAPQPTRSARLFRSDGPHSRPAAWSSSFGYSLRRSPL